MKKPAQKTFYSRINFLEKVLFTKHLSTMIKAGIPLSEALATLIEGTKSKTFKSVLASLLGDIENGQSLTKALKQFPWVFDEFYCSMIQIGEESGTLESNLDFLSEQLKESYALNKKIQGAMLYPGLVLSSTIIMGGFISFYILPKLADFFSAFEVQLPLTTRILLFFANSIKNYGFVGILGIVVFAIFFSFIYRLYSVKYFLSEKSLLIPVFGKLIGDAQLARFTRNLGVLLRSGIPITRSLEITSDTISNLKFKKDILQLGQIVAEGKSIGEALKRKNFWEFPSLVGKMISVGEKTGKLDEVLHYLAEFYEEEIEDTSKNLSTIIEPVLLITIGLIVGFVALAIISPIYELTGSIRK